MPGDNTQKLYIPKYYHLSKYIEDFKPNIIILPTPGFYGLTALKKAKEILDNKLLGNINMISARVRWCREQEYYEDGWHGTWKMDGGVVSQQAIHHLDAIQWLSGGVNRVVSHSSNQINKLEAEDTNISLLEFQNGAVGTFEATTSVRPKDYDAEISIFGSEGFIVVGGLSMNKIIELRSSKIDDCIKIKKQFS